MDFGQKGLRRFSAHERHEKDENFIEYFEEQLYFFFVYFVCFVGKQKEKLWQLKEQIRIRSLILRLIWDKESAPVFRNAAISGWK